MRPHPEVQIRWLIRRDMPSVLKIEADCFDQPWADEDFLTYLKQRNCIGMIAELEHEIVGFMVYMLHKSRLEIVNFAVAPESQRSGVGAAMIERLTDKLSQQRRNELLANVCETNEAMIGLLRSCGFKAVGVSRGQYGELDGYEFAYRIKAKAKK